MRKHVWAIAYGLLLTAFTAYILLDTFVITKVYSVVENETSAEMVPDTGAQEVKNKEGSTEEKAEAVITDTSYQDENISVTITEYREYDSSIYVAEVKLSSAEYLRTAFAQNSYGKNVTEKTSVTAKKTARSLPSTGTITARRNRDTSCATASFTGKQLPRNKRILLFMRTAPLRSSQRAVHQPRRCSKPGQGKSSPSGRHW